MAKGRERLRAGWVCAGLVALVFLTFGRSASNDFVSIDDDGYIYDNAQVTSGLTWSGVAWALTATSESNWHPLTWISHMADVLLFGVRPGPHHLVSVAIHAATAVLLFWFLLSATGALAASAAAAAVFAVHPLRVESVVWAAERKDVLSGMFWMLALVAYVGYTSRQGRGRYLAVLAFFALGLLAKPMLVTLPFVLLLLDAWPLGRWKGPRSADLRRASGPGESAKRLVMEKLPFFALSAASCVVTAWVQERAGSTSTLEAIPLGARISNSLVSYVAYLWDFVWPFGLGVLVPHPALALPASAASEGTRFIVAGAILVAATLVALRSWSARPHLAVGWLWYLGTLIPVIGLVQVGSQARADRYMYLPAVGLGIAVMWETGRQVGRRPALRLIVAAAVGAALVLLAATSWIQVGRWKDSETLYRHTLAVTSRNYLIHNNLGSVLEEKGRLDEAVEEYRRALEIRPDYAVAHYNIGVALKEKGDLPGARAAFERALSLRPRYLEAHSNLGTVLAALGDRAAASEKFEACLRIDPGFAPAWYNIAVLRLDRGDLPAARAAYENALRLNPRHAEAQNGLGSVLERQGALDDAATRYAAAIQVRPRYFEAWYNLGVVSLKQRDVPRAAEAFERAVRIQPAHARAHYALGSVRVQQGRLADAARELEEAARLDPSLTAAGDDLRKVRQALGGGSW